jgi:hypothetical protein
MLFLPHQLPNFFSWGQRHAGRVLNVAMTRDHVAVHLQADRCYTIGRAL